MKSGKPNLIGSLAVLMTKQTSLLVSSSLELTGPLKAPISYLSCQSPSINPGSGLSSREVTLQLLSLLTRFTAVFGMGTGGTTSPCHQKLHRGHTPKTTSMRALSRIHQRSSGEALDLLVPLGSNRHRPSTCGLSTGLSSRGLTWLTSGVSHLGVGFELRCFQLLSTPDTATRRLPLA